MEHVPLVIIGGGQSGLATATRSRERGMRPVVLEDGPSTAGSWPAYYPSLKLFSPARFSALPGRPFPGGGDRYPTRDEVADYLRTYGAGLDVEIRTGQRVSAVSRMSAGPFLLTIVGGTQLTADIVVAATGAFASPLTPALPGLTEFTGTVVHAAQYRHPAPFAGQRVVVVGGGNTAVQVAVELAQTARVTLTTRRPLRWIPQRLLGRDVHWWLNRTGLDTAPLGPVLRRRPAAVLDDGRYQRAIADSRPDHRQLFRQLDGTTVEWADGKTEQVDAIILATGYRPNLDYLSIPGALAADGRPHHHGGVSTTVAGLGFVGLSYQRSNASATIRGAARDAQYILGRLLRPDGRPP